MNGDRTPAQPLAGQDPPVSLLTCSMCGHRFDPAGHASCQACPLQSGCQLVCCPQCGFEMVNPERSVAARFMKRLFNKTT